MSGHGHHDAGADSHAGHDDHHDETTSDDFPPDEPHSPAWLPLLGGGLLLAAVGVFLLLGSDDKPAESDVQAAAPVAAPAVPAAPAQSARRTVPSLRPGTALPPGHVPVPAPRD